MAKWNEKLADWLTGGALTRSANAEFEWRQRAISKADRAQSISDFLDETIKHFESSMQSVIAARNITEARKIAKQALGDGE